MSAVVDVELVRVVAEGYGWARTVNSAIRIQARNLPRLRSSVAGARLVPGLGISNIAELALQPRKRLLQLDSAANSIDSFAPLGLQLRQLTVRRRQQVNRRVTSLLQMVCTVPCHQCILQVLLSQWSN